MPRVFYDLPKCGENTTNDEADDECLYLIHGSTFSLEDI